MIAAFTCTGCADTNSEDGLGECSTTIEPGPSPLRRLTRVEYNNTIFQLLGDSSQPADAFPPDEEAGGFDNQANVLVVSPLLAEGYLEAAEKLAEAHAAPFVSDIPSCAAGEENGCNTDIRGFIIDFGKRTFRRPLTEAEVSTFEALFIEGTALGEGGYSPETGVAMVMQAMLQSPHFLYRVEFGMPNPVGGDVVELSSWEIASRLSYLLWNTMPDDALFDAAERDELRDPAQIEFQARRMLATPRAREAVKNFHRQWLGLDNIEPSVLANGKSEEIYPDYYDGLPALWRLETEAFIDYAVFEQDANIETLFAAPYTMMNAELAAFYGVSGPSGIEFERVDLDPTKYAGFVTQPGLLALNAKTDRSSPIHRGKWVRQYLLCQDPPPPPDNVPEAPEVDETQTTREQFSQHSTDPVCAGCHQLMDPIGFGFEHFDGIGRYRATEWGLPIDARGELTATDVDGEFNGAVELANKLASSEQVKSCVVSQWFRFGYGRFEEETDDCSVRELESAFAAANYDIKELIVALTLTDAFRYQHAIAGEN